ncbi:MAG: hypothetical protein ACTS8H_02040 [Arsenophonus sp. NC-PE1-MAG3]
MIDATNVHLQGIGVKNIEQYNFDLHLNGGAYQLTGKSLQMS